MQDRCGAPRRIHFPDARLWCPVRPVFLSRFLVADPGARFLITARGDRERHRDSIRTIFVREMLRRSSSLLPTRRITETYDSFSSCITLVP